jgi:hypothetical protein
MPFLFVPEMPNITDSSTLDISSFKAVRCVLQYLQM